MSDSQAYEEVAIASDGVRVVKRFEEDEFPVPAIAFEFASEREETVEIRLTDDVPDGVEVEDLGFHPEYGSEYWTIDEDQITFEKDLTANSDYTTVYGIRATGTDDVEQFLTEPAIEEVDPPLPDAEGTSEEVTDDIIPESDDDVVRDVISGDGSVPGLEEESDSEGEGDEIETLDLKDPNAPDGEETTVSSDGESANGETAGATVAAEGSIVSAMANEIRENEVSVDDLKLVQRAIDKLSEEEETDGVKDARIERLQTDIADLRAYTDALEEFLDENGTGEQLIEDFEEQLEQFNADLREMQSDVAATTDTVDAVEDEVEEMQSEMNTVTDEVETVESSVSDLQETIDELEASVAELEEEVTEEDVTERLADIESDLTELRDWQDQIKSTFGG